MTTLEHAQLALAELLASAGYQKARDQNKTDAFWHQTHAYKCEREIRAVIADLTAAPPPPPPPPPAALPKKGGATGFTILNRGDADRNFELDEWAAAGCKILRYDCVDIATFPKVLAGCEARGMKSIACLRGTAGPTTVSGAASFAQRMAANYGDRVACWSYCNEPNLGNPPLYPDPTQYGRELSAAYGAIKAELGSDALVAGGTLGWDAPGKFSNFWPSAMNGGARDHFDLLDLHLYVDPSYINWTEGFNLDRQGKPVIVTEAGEGSGKVGETKQAQIIVAGLKDPRPIVVCTYTMMDDTIPDGFGMLRLNRTRKPSWDAYRTAAV